MAKTTKKKSGMTASAKRARRIQTASMRASKSNPKERTATKGQKFTRQDEAELNHFMTKASAREIDEIIERVGISDILGEVIDSWVIARGKDHPEDFTKYVKHNVGWVYACVRVIAEAVAGQQMNFYMLPATKMSAAREDYVPLPRNHPFVKLFRQPNPNTTWTEMITELVTFLMLTGNAYWHMPRGKKAKKLGISGKMPPMELWTLPAQFMYVVPDAVKVIAEWIYRPTTGKAKGINIPAEEVLQFKLPNTQNRFYGAGPLGAAAPAVNSDEYMTEAQDASLRNQARPGIVAKKTTKDGRKLTKLERRLTEAMLLRFVGSNRQGRSLVTDETWEFSDFAGKNAQPREIDYTKSGDFIRKRIMAIFGVGAAILGLVEDSNRANMEAAQWAFGMWRINPLLRLISDRINTFLAPLFASGDEELIVEFESAVPQDREADRKDMELGILGGTLSIDEVRMDFHGKKPLKKEAKTPGDTPYMPMGKTPVLPIKSKEQATAPNQQPPTPPQENSPEDEEKPDDEEKTEDEGEEEEKPEDGEGAAKKAIPFPQERATVTGGMSVASLVDALADVKTEADAVNEAVKGEIERLTVLGASLEKLVLDSATPGRSFRPRADGPALIPDDVLISSEPFQDALAERAEEYWERTICNANHDLLDATIRQGIADGVGAREMALRLRGLVSASPYGSADVRARRIARTETIGAMNGGSQALRDVEQIPNKEWISTLDDRTRETHYQADGQIVPNHKRFKVGSALLMYPADPNVARTQLKEIVNCRCASAGVVDTERLRPPKIREDIQSLWIRQYEHNDATLHTLFREYLISFFGRVLRRYAQIIAQEK